MLDKFISWVMQGRPFGSRAASSNYIYHIRPQLNVDVVTIVELQTYFYAS